MLGVSWCFTAAVFTAQPVAEDPIAAYERREVRVDTVFVRDEGKDTGQEVLAKRFSPRLGSGQPLPGPTFYEYVDRPDLATKYRARQRRKRILLGVGGGLVALGTGLTLGYIGVQDRRSGNALLGSGVSLLFAGFIPLGFGAAMSPHPVGPEVVQALVRDKNRRLRISLGLPAELRITPLASRDVAGAQLSARF